MLTRFNDLIPFDQSGNVQTAFLSASQIVFDEMQKIALDVEKKKAYGTTSALFATVKNIIAAKFGSYTRKGVLYYPYALPIFRNDNETEAAKRLFVEMLLPFSNFLKAAYFEVNINPIVDVEPSNVAASGIGIATTKNKQKTQTGQSSTDTRTTNGTTTSAENGRDDVEFSAFQSESDRTDETRKNEKTGNTSANTTANGTTSAQGNSETEFITHDAAYMSRVTEYMNASPTLKKLIAAFDAVLIRNPDNDDLPEIGGYCASDEWYFW
jgi:hypothetical protein